MPKLNGTEKFLFMLLEPESCIMYSYPSKEEYLADLLNPTAVATDTANSFGADLVSNKDLSYGI